MGEKRRARSQKEKPKKERTESTPPGYLDLNKLERIYESSEYIATPTIWKPHKFGCCSVQVTSGTDGASSGVTESVTSAGALVCSSKGGRSRFTSHSNAKTIAHTLLTKWSQENRFMNPKISVKDIAGEVRLYAGQVTESFVREVHQHMNGKSRTGSLASEMQMVAAMQAVAAIANEDGHRVTILVGSAAQVPPTRAVHVGLALRPQFPLRRPRPRSPAAVPPLDRSSTSDKLRCRRCDTRV